VETGSVQRQVGSGRRKATTSEENERVRLAVVAKPITTAQEITGIIYFLSFHLILYLN
jgi:hypothetical protein